MKIALHAFRDEAAEAQRLANALQIPLAVVDVHIFPDGETAPRIPEPAGTTIVYRSLHRPNEKLLELLLSVDAWRRNGVENLVLVAPYLPYMRQDTAFRPGEPISQRVVAGLLDVAFDRVITVDPHLHRTASLAELFPTCTSTHLHAADALVPHLRAAHLIPTTLVIGPDIESDPWVTRIAKPLGLGHATFRKIRRGDADVEIRSPDGLPVAGRPILLVDDICSTGGTLRKATSLLHASGAGPITIFISHMLGDVKVSESLLQAGAARIISSDSCPGPTGEIHLAQLIAQALTGST
jgi:ribose-phosphate pyrophosphokinase